MAERPRFITDENVGKLTRLLRLLGFDAVFFSGENDAQLVNLAWKEGRILLTRDTHILKRRPVASGRVKAMLIQSDSIDSQIKQVVAELNLYPQIKPFTLCLEDNHALLPRTREEVQDRVPPYVWQTQLDYVECPHCHRIYWKGTHWQAMSRRLEKLGESKNDAV
jgi:uncharacterized protein